MRAEFSARWIDRANLHITLWFIGEVVDDRRGDQRFAAPAVRGRSFLSRSRGMRRVPPSGAPCGCRIRTTTAPSHAGTLRPHRDRLMLLGLQGGAPCHPATSLLRVKDPGRAPWPRHSRTIAAVPAACGKRRMPRPLFRSRLSPQGAPLSRQCARTLMVMWVLLGYLADRCLCVPARPSRRH